MKKKIASALPVIIFFLLLFYTTIVFFGIRYVILVPLITVLFKINYQKRISMKKILWILTLQLLLGILAYIASQSLIFCILLNILVPFLLVFLQASQFNQMGYFAGVMGFTFLQLMPLGKNEFLTMMEALLYGLLIFAGALLLYGTFNNKKVKNYEYEIKGLALIKENLTLLSYEHVNEKEIKKNNEALFQIEQVLYKSAYQKRGFSYMITGEGKLNYLFALFFQRILYFFVKYPQESGEFTSQEKQLLKQTAEYMEKAIEEELLSEKLTYQGNQLLECLSSSNCPVCEFLENFLNLFLIILNNKKQVDNNELKYDWKLTVKQQKAKIFRNLNLDTFEFRFALRMSMVLTMGFAYSNISHAEHGYWLPLNAFILLRPMYEDSAYRMKTRFIGTAAGCILIYFLSPLLHNPSGHFVLSTIMVVCMYAETPGTWFHSFSVTCFALSMTTLALQSTLAIELRMMYVIIAILLVLIINRFVFPTSMSSQLRYNFQLIFHMQHIYLRLLANSLNQSIDYSQICDAQLRYHLAYEQTLQYLKHPKYQKKQQSYREFLRISWHMVAEMEQMLFLIRNQKEVLGDPKIMEDYLTFTEYMIDQIQQMLHMKSESSTANYSIETIHYKRAIDGAPRLSVLMDNYAKNISRLYLLICKENLKHFRK